MMLAPVRGSNLNRNSTQPLLPCPSFEACLSHRSHLGSFGCRISLATFIHEHIYPHPQALTLCGVRGCPKRGAVKPEGRDTS